MPNATVSPELHHYDLKSLEGAWVKLRQLPYHDMLVRRDKGSIASMEQQQTTKKRGEPVNTKFILESLQTWEQDYMFKNCIAEHNLEDDKGELLNFNNPFAFKNLRPDIGLEIEQLISDLNQGESVDKDFQTAPLSSSEPPKPEPLTLASTDTPTS